MIFAARSDPKAIVLTGTDCSTDSLVTIGSRSAPHEAALRL
jgi:hypothetical protein